MTSGASTLIAQNKDCYNWGIIGCGKISSDFANCLSVHKNAKVIGCASRSIETARSFASKFNIAADNAYASYETLVQDPHIDIVYIGNIHPSHHKCVLLALNHGKHVLCEKPLGMNAREVSEMIAVAKQKQLFFCEALWTRFFPIVRKARALMASGVIGDIVSYSGDFGFEFPSAKAVPRLWVNELGGGALLDIGCYTISPLTWIFGAQMPRRIRAAGIVSKEFGVDVMASATLIYNHKQFANIHCTGNGQTPGEIYITGTQGMIHIFSPGHCPTKMNVQLYDTVKRSVRSEQTYTYPLPAVTAEFAIPDFNFPGSQGLLYQVNAITKCLDEGRVESPEYTWQEMLICAQISDEIRAQIGVTYAQDNIRSSKL